MKVQTGMSLRVLFSISVNSSSSVAVRVSLGMGSAQPTNRTPHFGDQLCRPFQLVKKIVRGFDRNGRDRAAGENEYRQARVELPQFFHEGNSLDALGVVSDYQVNLMGV